MLAILLVLGLFILRADLFPASHQQIELENLVNGEPRVDTIWRSGASGGKAVRLDSMDSNCRFEFKLCSTPRPREKYVKLQLKNLRFSNDGPSDLIKFYINGRNFGNASTKAVSAHGYAWNKFYNSGRIGRTQYLHKADFNLTIYALPDRSGVELDRVDLTFVGQDPMHDLVCEKKFVCESNKD